MCIIIKLVAALNDVWDAALNDVWDAAILINGQRGNLVLLNQFCFDLS